ncbi:type II toxin-antitoxin system Phd/YefM family antitoxin [Rhizobium sp. PAMB 3182]
MNGNPHYDHSGHDVDFAMKEIQLKDAKARLSAVVDDAVNGDGAIITRHGKRDAVLISFEEFQRLTRQVPSFGWLLAHAPVEDEDLPTRKSARRADEDAV